MNTGRGARLKELRKQEGLLLRQVGAHFDIDKSAVGQWEAETSSPDRRKLVELDRLYHANGEVLALFDVSRQDAELVELRDQVAKLRLAVRELLSLAKLDVEAWLPEPPAAAAAEQ